MFRRKLVRLPWLRVSEGQMLQMGKGRLPADMAAADPAVAPDPEYIAEAGHPSEDAWARERRRYREKEEHRR